MSGSEVVFLLLAALVVLGPERLPGVIRTVGRLYGELRRAAQGIEKDLKDTFDAPIKDFQSTVQSVTHGFGEVDTEPSPPMRPEKSATPEEIEQMQSATDDEGRTS